MFSRDADSPPDLCGTVECGEDFFERAQHAFTVQNAQPAVKTKRTVQIVMTSAMSGNGNDFDLTEPHGRLQWARARAGFLDATSAARRFGWNENTYRSHEGGERGITRAYKEYAKKYRVSPAWLLTGEGPPEGRTIEIKGYVGAGQAVELCDQGTGEEVELPFQDPDDWEVVEVRGASMYPWAIDGTRLFYRARAYDPMTLLGRECVVQLENGGHYVKILSRGSAPGLFNLGSYNAPPIEDQTIVWAAPIVWRKDPER